MTGQLQNLSEQRSRREVAELLRSTLENSEKRSLKAAAKLVGVSFLSTLRRKADATRG